MRTNLFASLRESWKRLFIAWSCQAKESFYTSTYVYICLYKPIDVIEDEDSVQTMKTLFN